MKFLVYCTLRGDGLPCDELPKGVDGEAVKLLSAEGLMAAYSLISECGATPTVSRVVAYARVVERIQRTASVLPMRYGCLLDSEAEVGELLQKHRDEFRAALDELEGCVEVGLRVLLRADTGATARDDDRTADGPPGTAYLTRRKTYYAGHELDLAASQSAAAEVRRALDGLFVRFKEERFFSSGTQMLSLHFLVRGERLEDFRAAFTRLQQDAPDKVLLTGPWPPYNFVPPAFLQLTGHKDGL